MHLLKRIICCFFIVMVVGVIGFIIAIPLVNNNIAKKELKRLEKLPLPKNAQCIEVTSKAGKMSGNGNGMQYVGVMLIKSDMKMDDLEKYYEDFSNEKHEIGVFSDPSKIIEDWRLDLDSDVGKEGYYLVYSWTDVYSESFSGVDEFFSEWDLRGH